MPHPRPSCYRHPLVNVFIRILDRGEFIMVYICYVMTGRFYLMSVLYMQFYGFFLRKRSMCGTSQF